MRFDLGAGTPPTSTGVSIPGTAFGYGGDGFWYANGGPTAERQLYRFRPEEAGTNPALVGTGARSIDDIATARDGTMYGVGEGFLFRIDQSTGAQTDVGPVGFPASGLAFSRGELLTMDGARLMRLDTAT